MPPRERAVDRGSRRATRAIVTIGTEIRDARTTACLTQAQVAAACGISQSFEGKIERAEVRRISVILLAQVCEVVGLELSVRTFPGARGLRDAGHVALLGRLRGRLHQSWSWRTEVPLPIPGDPRAWDAVISHSGVRIGIEAETRVRDAQALDRRVALKLRDSGLDHALLILADTRTNRQALRDFGDALRSNFPLPGRTALEALVAGDDPRGCAIILI